MALESATYISELVATNPDGNDDYATADDHIRLMKSVLQAQFTSLGAAAVTTTAAELNTLDGVAATLTAAELNILDGVTAVAADLNILAGADAAGVTAAEFAFLNGVTSAIQTQLDNKQPLDADLVAIAGISHGDGTFIVSTGTGWVGENGATARASLGLTIGTDVQAFDAHLQDIADVAAPTGADQMLVSTGAGTYALESGATLLGSIGAAATSHTHAGTDIASGTIAGARLGTFLEDLAGLSAPSAADQMLVSTAAGVWALESGATLRGSIGAAAAGVSAVQTAASRTRNNTTSLTNHADLAGLSLSANTWYSFEIVLYQNADAAGIDMDMALSFSQTPQDTGEWHFQQTTVISGENQDYAEDTTTTFTVDLTTSRCVNVIKGVFRTNASTGGTVSFQWAQNVLTAQNIYTFVGSYFRCTPI